MKHPSTVALDRDGIRIDGEHRILLCASVFYFRIPAELWRDRIRKLRLSGYHTADVYFPWNYHELSPGEWDFTGERDADAFLAMLAEEGISVVARPGPYICSEWDGGAIPAWHLVGGMPIRTADPRWMSAVKVWYDRILPIIARYQAGAGGTVILVQVDNELDFFDCPDPAAYMGALKDLCRDAGITVPVFGCAGQGGTMGATGYAEGVDPTYNFYPAERDPSFDPVALEYYRTLRARELPFLITETSREHFLLRRELSNGARLLGAYNQVGGTNFGFTGSVNNWGKGESPLSYLSTDYDFASMIDPFGGFREEALEGRLLGGMIDALGTRLATAEAGMPEPGTVNWERLQEQNGLSIRMLDMGAGGRLLCLPNFSEVAESVEIRFDGEAFTMAVGAWRAPFLPFDLPLAAAGCDGLLKRASCELLQFLPGAVLLHADDLPGEIPFADFVSASGCRIRTAGFGTHGIELDGRPLRVELMKREEARRIDIGRGSFDGSVSRVPLVRALPAAEVQSPAAMSEWMSPLVGSNGLKMEEMGLWRGAAEYAVEAEPGRAILLKGAADTVQAWNGGEWKSIRVSGAQWQEYRPDSAADGCWRFLVDSWGHSNFDDARLPSMRIAMHKGVEAIHQVDRIEDRSLLWRFRVMNEWLPDSIEESDDPMEAFLPPNAWNSTRMPLIARYAIRWTRDAGSRACALRMADGEAETAVYVDGRFVGVLNPFDPWLELTEAFADGREHALALLCRKRHWAEPAGVPMLYHLTPLVPKTRGYSDRSLENSHPDGLRISEDATMQRLEELLLAPGAAACARIPLDEFPPACRRLRLRLREMKAVVLFNGRLLGRVYGESASRPDMVGGDPEILYLPKPWHHPSGNLLTILLEGIGRDAAVVSATLEE